MDELLLYRRIPFQLNTLTVPLGDLKILGVHFSDSIPCEIQKIEDDSPILQEAIRCLGQMAFQLCIPGKIELCGPIDAHTLESVLGTYPDVPDRKLVFKNRGERFEDDLVTTTVLPIGYIDASFRSSNELFQSRNRVFVKSSGYRNFTFPIGHFVEKVIIPNIFESEGGYRTPQRLFETLDHFAKIPGRKIVFRKKIPRGSVITKITLPKDHINQNLYLKEGEGFRKLPVVSSSSYELHAPVSHIIEKVIIPNEMSIERIRHAIVEKVLDYFSQVEGRVIVLRECYKDVPKAGGMVAITLPTGNLGMQFERICNHIRLSGVKTDFRKKCPIGFYVERLIIPGKMDLIGIDELKDVISLTKKLRDFSHVENRILVLKQFKRDILRRTSGTRFECEIV